MTADSSVAVAAFSDWHDLHEPAVAALTSVSALPAHAVLETYAVLTRLPAGLAVPGRVAEATLGRLAQAAPLRLGVDSRRRLVSTLAAAGVEGGAVYDGLVGLEAREHGETLLTLDRRARRTYERLGVPYEMIAP